MELPWRLFAGILVLWLLIGVVPFLYWRDLHAAAEFANAFGFVNALFAALAFGGVIWAIRLQTRELELQRLEIEETRDELRRSADAQNQSQQMHFLAALLAARNNVAQGYAAAAARETGVLRPSHTAHRQHLAELEWLLQCVDRYESNPFAVPPPTTLVTHQVALLLARSYPILDSALSNRASNHLRSLLLELNHSLRELRRLLSGEQTPVREFIELLDRSIASAESVNTADDFDEIAQTCYTVFNGLHAHVSASLGTTIPALSPHLRTRTPKA
jgi:hypothetical protein